MPNKRAAGLVGVTIRLAPDLAARLDAAVAAFRAKNPGARYDRTDVIRGLLLTSLPLLEDESAPVKPAAKGPAKKKRGA